MRQRWGLQAAMTATFVTVTAGAVLLTELAIFGAAALSPPTPLTPQAVQGLVQATAQALAAKAGNVAGKSGRLPSDLGASQTQPSPGQAQPDGNGGVSIPMTASPGCYLAPASFAVAVDRTGTVLASTYPACYPVGSQGSAAQGGVPRKVLTFARWAVQTSGRLPLPEGNVVWAAAPIMASVPAKGATAATAGAVYGMLYVEVPAAAPGIGGVTVSPGLIRTGLFVLAAAVPVGLVFGLLSTRRLTRRLKRLAALTLEVADGGFERRVQVRGHNEVSALEENFNKMASQLQASLDARRQLAEANARHAERARIARELHDSISQELFSLSVLAGGLRRALPPGSNVLTEVETMERTAGDTMREMQALLLALRPVALDELGLASAIEGVCEAYAQRLGVQVLAEIEPVTLPPDLEHAVLRVTQEAVANAVRHADADRVTIRLSSDNGHVVLTVSDNGRGFDVAAEQAHAVGLGLRAMRERVAEQDGTLVIISAAETGTTVRASFAVSVPR